MTTTRVYIKNGRYYYVQDLEETNSKGRPKQKWHKLTRVDEGEAVMHTALGELLGQAAVTEGRLPALIREFGKVHFPGLTAGVRREYERCYAIIARAFEAFDGPDVQPGDVLKFLADNFTGKPTARKHYKARLSTFFAWCVLNPHTGVTINPCREIRLPSPPKRKGRFDAARWWAMHDALTPMGQCFADLTYLTRQRPTEIRLLRESQISAERIHFRPTKTDTSSGEEAEILITPEIQAVLERARELRREIFARRKVSTLRKADHYLIVSEDGQRFTKSGLNSLWRRAREAAGITERPPTTRDIRPYALSQMEEQGISLREIQKSAAHASITTTEGYLDQYRDRLSSARLMRPVRPKT